MTSTAASISWADWTKIDQKRQSSQSGSQKALSVFDAHMKGHSKSHSSLVSKKSNIIATIVQQPTVITFESCLSDAEFLVSAKEKLTAATKTHAFFETRFKFVNIQSLAGIRTTPSLSPREKLRILDESINDLPLHHRPIELEKFKAAVDHADRILNQSEQVNESTVGDVYNRFFSLMERLIKQEDSAAQEIYNKIKARTDSVDLLTTLISKINNAPKGTVDWSKDEEMKKLIEAAKVIGVPIQEGYKFTEEQRVVLVKNIEMKKGNMEHMTQIERVDFQQRMQNSSIWHQTRSNILKYLERTASTITGNLRPH